jgi:hypothetical protein
MGTEGSRIERARGRAAAAKTATALAAGLAFVAALGLTRASRPGHPVPKLAAPPSFVAVVRQDRLEAGILGPSTAPADALSGVS